MYEINYSKLFKVLSFSLDTGLSRLLSWSIALSTVVCWKSAEASTTHFSAKPSDSLASCMLLRCRLHTAPSFIVNWVKVRTVW